MTQIKKTTIANFLNFPKTQDFLEANLKEKKGEFVSNLIAMTEADNNLAQCDPKQLMMCAMNATALNLPLNRNLGYAYVIPYKGVPSFQIGFKGLVQLAIRTGLYETLNATEVREGEITRNKITGEISYHKDNEEGKIVGYLAYLKLNTGFRASLYMTEAEIEDHARRYSKMYQSDRKNNTRKSKWSDPEERPKMAKKTVLKGLLGTYGILTTEMVRAIEADNEAERDNGQRFDEVEIIEQDEPQRRREPSHQAEPEKVQI